MFGDVISFIFTAIVVILLVVGFVVAGMWFTGRGIFRKVKGKVEQRKEKRLGNKG